VCVCVCVCEIEREREREEEFVCTICLYVLRGRCICAEDAYDDMLVRGFCRCLCLMAIFLFVSDNYPSELRHRHGRAQKAKKVVNIVLLSSACLSRDNIEPFPTINRIPALLLIHINTHNTRDRKSQ
jgi:hypothetical protein